MGRSLSVAKTVLARCQSLAQYSEEPGFTTRTFLSEPMHAVHGCLRNWMESAGMTVSVDHAGNLHGFYPAANRPARRLFIGSHLDTVPRAGAFDGILGVVLGVALVEILAGRRMAFEIDVVGFSEEEGVRFGVPFIGSRAFIGDLDRELIARISDAVAAFGLEPSRIHEAEAGSGALGYLEFHIEQGPVLDSLNLPLGVVEAIVGQSRGNMLFEGRTNHAGTTPMNLRQDALAAAAEWICAVEREAGAIAGSPGGLVATVGSLHVSPGADNVIAGSVRASLDVRHADDAVRRDAVKRLVDCACQIAARRRLAVQWEPRLDQPAVVMDAGLTDLLGDSKLHRITSGAGHDAMIVARRMPAAMLFLRSPGGISHHPDETVLVEDVAAALEVGMGFLERLETRHV
jgi:allantoate deiminase